MMGSPGKTLETAVAGLAEAMAKAGLCGLVAALCTDESLFLLVSAYGAIHMALFSGQTHVPAIDSFLFSLVVFYQDIQTEGALAIARRSPFAFFLGSVAGAGIGMAWKKRTVPAEPVIGS